MKLRGSFGISGNNNIGNYQSIAQYGTVRTFVGGAPVIGFAPSFLANSDLKWESTEQINGAIDLGFFDNSLNLTAEYYVKTTTDLLLSRPVGTQATGFGSQLDNVGSVENKGFELTIGYNKLGQKFNWNSSFNISFNRSKVLELQPGTEEIINGIGRGESAWGRTLIRPGEEIGLFWGYIFDGIWDSEEEILAEGSTVGGINIPGLPQYADLNGDGFRRNSDDRAIIGNPNPDFIFGFSNDLQYQNWTLYLFVNGSYGNDIADLNGIGLLSKPQKHNVYRRVFEERWQGPGTSTTIEAPLTNAGEWKNFSSRDVQDGSYIRLKTINLSYDFTSAQLEAWGLGTFDSAQVYIAGDNLITLTNYTGYDPEVDLYSTSNVQLGVDNGGYPVAKSVRLGFTFTF